MFVSAEVSHYWKRAVKGRTGSYGYQHEFCPLCRQSSTEKVLRRIFGPTKEKDGTWRIKTNDELD